MATSPKRRPALQVLVETKALQARRDVSKRRISAAKRASLAPRAPAAALTSYSAVMDTYAERVARLVEQKVVTPLSHGLQPAWAELQMQLDALAANHRRSALAAARRASKHARQEVARILRVAVNEDLRAQFAVEAFARQAEARLKAAGAAQLARLQEVVQESQDPEKIRQALWVSRQRAQLVARDEIHGIHAETVRTWARATGSTHFLWVTARDERVRDEHAVLDGKVFAWDEPPAVGLPGQPHNCRCKALPVEATY